jgi:hypothetical protein
MASMPPPASTISCSITLPREEANSLCSRCARTNADRTVTSACFISSSALRHRSTLSAIETEKGSCSSGVWYSPVVASTGASERR